MTHDVEILLIDGSRFTVAPLSTADLRAYQEEDAADALVREVWMIVRGAYGHDRRLTVIDTEGRKYTAQFNAELVAAVLVSEEA